MIDRQERRTVWRFAIGQHWLTHQQLEVIKRSVFDRGYRVSKYKCYLHGSLVLQMADAAEDVQIFDQ